MQPGEFKFFCLLRVRYGEVDPQAVVFNARYLDYADVAITEYWRSFGLSVVPNADQPSFQLVHAEVEYKAPIRLDEEIVLYVATREIGSSSITTLVEMRGPAGDSRARVEEVHVNVNLQTGKSQHVPDDLVERIEAFEGRSLTREKR